MLTHAELKAKSTEERKMLLDEIARNRPGDFLQQVQIVAVGGESPLSGDPTFDYAVRIQKLLPRLRRQKEAASFKKGKRGTQFHIQV